MKRLLFAFLPLFLFACVLMGCSEENERTWTAGEYELVGVWEPSEDRDESEINIRSDGKLYTVQLSELSETDRNYVAQKRQEANRKAVPAKENPFKIKPHKTGERMVKTADGIEYAFRWCPAGTFMMGSHKSESNRDDDETQHEVTLTQGFWMLETEVTQAMWKSVMGENPSEFKGDQNPVECVSWDDCQEFCRKLSSKLGITVSLPTEAQWEYACRAGTTGQCAGNLDVMGWYLSNSERKTHPVGQKQPNAWGLYDMHGNVYEWCSDQYGWACCADSPTSDSSSWRVFRGGYWFSRACNCRSTFRYGFTPGYRGNDLGLRIVLAATPVEPAAQVAFVPGSKVGERMVKTVDGIEYAFRWCPAGTFTMGSPESELGRYDGETQHEVTLTRGFWMLETEVTQAMWESVMGATLKEQARKMLQDDTEYDFGSSGKKTLREFYGFQRDENPSSVLVGKGADRPIYYVSWNECQEFCEKLSSKLGVTVSLPTEAQWEYACRAGSETALPNGPIEILGTRNAPALDSIAWYGGNSMRDFEGTSRWNSSSWPETQYPGGICGVHPVGQKEPNAWGLYDMIGNVWEWCSDTYESDFYAELPTSAPLNSHRGSYRVGRGGCWVNLASNCRSANRGGATPGNRSNNLGFRMVWQDSGE